MTSINEEEIKKNVQDKDSWLRLIYLVLFGLIFYLCFFVLGFAALVQFLAKLFTGAPIAGLVEFGEDLATYIGQIARYMTFASNEKPFPFAALPHKAADTPS